MKFNFNMKERFKRINTKKNRYLLVSVISLLLASYFTVVLFESYVKYNNFSNASMLSFKRIFNSRIFWYDMTIVFSLLLFITGFTLNAFYSIAICGSFFSVLAFVNSEKMGIRKAPLLPEDLLLASEAKALSGMAGGASVIKLFVTVALVLAVTVAVNVFVKKKLRLQRNRKKSLVFRGILLFVSAFTLVFITKPIRQIVKNEHYIGFLDAWIIQWNPSLNYEANGFIIGFVSNLSKAELPKPREYSQEKIESIVAKYQAVADLENVSRKSLEDGDINIILVLSESLADPLDLKEDYPFKGDDPLPNFRKITAECPSGHLFSSTYAGGTANIEFEVYTGLSTYFSQAVPYTQILPKVKAFPSVAEVMGSQGYLCTGMHSYFGSMYKRNIVYPVLGFHNFYDCDDYSYRDVESNAKNSQYITDAASYKQVIDQLNSTEQKQFISLVTMQTHMPYADRYSVTSFKTESDKKHIDQYMQTVNSADKALGEFITALEESGKKVVVCFFGDHLPWVYYGEDTDEDNPLKYTTPYFIYSNYERQEAEKLDRISSNYLFNEVFNCLKFKKPWLFYLLDELKKECPVLTRTSHPEEPDNEVFREYELIVYDIVSGKKYSEKD